MVKSNGNFQCFPIHGVMMAIACGLPILAGCSKPTFVMETQPRAILASNPSTAEEIDEEAEWEAHELATDGVRVDVLIELLDAIQAELLMEGLCKGGEDLELWVEPSDTPRVYSLLYRIPDMPYLHRLAYVQKDGVAFLAMDLGFYTEIPDDHRYDIGTLPPEQAAEWLPYATHVTARLSDALTPEQIRRYNGREGREYQACSGL
jgi:hypothetical protein